MSSRLHGQAIACSHGIVMGRVQKVNVGQLHIPEYHLEPEAVAAEQARLQQAVDAALQELSAEYESLLKLKQQEPVLILDAHRMLLKDPELIEYPQSLIQHERINAEWALKRQVELLTATFDQMHDQYLRSKRMDIEQVAERLMRHLLACPFQPQLPVEQAAVVVIAPYLSPSDLVVLWHAGVAGVLCEQGSVNAHAMIVARGIGLPAMMGMELDAAQVSDGDVVILDAERNYWQLKPSEQEQQAYRKFMEAMQLARQGLMAFAAQSSRSKDGVSLPILANIDCDDELQFAHRVGAEGIGLCRTELLFLQHRHVPSEHEQYQDYMRILQGAGGLPVTFRLLDVGGDKPALFQKFMGHAYQADNPNLGLRGVRLLLHAPEVLETQIRALLRAAEHGDVRLLVPMISHENEMPQVRAMMERCCQEMQGVEPLPLGCMIETPAAVMMAETLARQSDFFAVGSNDLTQYTFAADRADDEVADYYQEKHPIILSMIEQVTQVAHHYGLKVSVCGELAAHEACTQAFLDMGVDALSMSLHSVLPVRRHLSRLQRRQ